MVSHSERLLLARGSCCPADLEFCGPLSLLGSPVGTTGSVCTAINTIMLSRSAGELATTRTCSPLGPSTIPTEDTTVAVTVKVPWADLPSTEPAVAGSPLCCALAPRVRPRQNTSVRQLKGSIRKSALTQGFQRLSASFFQAITSLGSRASTA